MKFKRTGAWLLILFAIGFTVFAWIVPSLRPPVAETISEGDLVPAGRTTTGESAYYVFKSEVKDWVEILKPLIPLAAGILGAKLAGRKKGQE